MMKYLTPRNVFLYFVVLGIVGVAFIEYVFWAKHNFYDFAAAAVLTSYILRKGK